MTKETFELASDLIDDINTLKQIKSEYDNSHWVGFYGAEVKEQPISNSILRDDLEKFIDVELTKLQLELEKL